MEGPENNTDIRILKSDYVREYVESDTYREAMRQTFATRARIGRVLGRFLLDHPWGQFLVKTQVFSDPILVEEQKHEQKVRALSEKIAETLPQVRSEDIELLTRMEPDFQPRTPEQVILETCIDQIARYQRLARDNYNPNRDLGLCYDISFRNIVNVLPAMPAEQRITMEEIMAETIVAHKTAELRDRFYLLLSNRDWPGFLEFLDHHQNDVHWGSQLNSLVFQHRHYIFPNRHFRASLFQYMMTLLIVHGEARFDRFDAFWQDAGLDMSDPAELQQLCRENFPYDHWYEVMNENTARYFGLLEILHSYGIRP